MIYAEVLLIPEWTQVSLNAEQIRINGGVPPPPEPILPIEFVIQLYNPDQQITVRHRPASWSSAASWEFEIPQQTFRAPSMSALDRTQHDPAAAETTPRVGFKWKKDSKLSKDLACFLSGKSLNPDGSKKKHREPDITIAIFKALKEVTLYEPNLVRVDVEDIKGLEVVLLLSSTVIKDVYFSSMKETFNLTTGARKTTQTNSLAPVPASSLTGGPLAQSPTMLAPKPARDPRVPPTDPRTQWEIDAETARLRRQAAEEERQQRKRDQAQEIQLRKMLEAEEQEERRRQAEINNETERLKRVYGAPGPSAPPQSGPARHRHSSDPRVHSAYHQSQPSTYTPAPAAWGSYNAGPYMSGGYASQSTFLTPMQQQQQLKNKSSIFSFRRSSEQDQHKLGRKRSAVF